MSLPKRSLGVSGIEITATGFGAWALGGGGWAYGWGPQDDDESSGPFDMPWSRASIGSIPQRYMAWAFRGSGWPTPPRAPGIRSAAGLYQMRPGVGCSTILTQSPTNPDAGVDSQGM